LIYKMRRKTNKNDTSAKKRSKNSTIKKEPKSATKGIYKEIEYDSLVELGMLQWLFELKAVGYIKAIKRADSYLLSDAYINHYAEGEEYITYIEVKPPFDRNNMERLFKLNQKWMLQKHDVFINLVKIKELFEKTFTPKEYLTTPSGKKRVLRWKSKTVFSFINNKK